MFNNGKGFNPMSMMGNMMGNMGGKGGGNPMAMISQMFGNNPQMMNMAQQIMSGNVNQQQLQNMLNQQMGAGAPNLQVIVDTFKRLQENGEVIVTDDRALYSKFAGMGIDILRYSPNVRGNAIMTKAEFEQKYM